jgi:zinc protease
MRYILWMIVSVTLIPTLTFADNTRAFTLKNGLKLIVREDHRAPIVLNSIWYKVGGSYEPNGKTGISHMLEHMMFKGTSQFGPGVFNQIIGADGGDNNANTAEDFTVYFETLSPKKLDTALQLEADRMQHLLLNDAAFQTERKVVMEERRMRVDDNPQMTTYERFRATAFVNNPYHNPVVGWMTDIEHYHIEDLRHWYHEWYTPSNAVIIVIGDVNADAVYQAVKKYFDAIPASTIPTLKPRQEVQSLGEKTIQVHRPAQLPWLIMGYQVPASSYTLMVCAKILGGGNSARFSNDLVRKNQIAVEADASYSFYHLHQTLFMLSGTPTPKQSINGLKNAFFHEIKRLQTTLVSQDELNRVKAQLIASRIYQNDSLLKQAFDLGQPEMVGLSWESSKQFAEKVQLVTPEDIRAAAKKYFTKNRLTVAELVPQ